MPREGMSGTRTGGAGSGRVTDGRVSPEHGTRNGYPTAFGRGNGGHLVTPSEATTAPSSRIGGLP